MTPAQLIKAALQHKSVTGFHLDGTIRPMPAAFIVSMQFRLVMLVAPRLKIYHPKKKATPRWKLTTN